VAGRKALGFADVGASGLVVWFVRALARTIRLQQTAGLRFLLSLEVLGFHTSLFGGC
jgi:hypothetical protein